MASKNIEFKVGFLVLIAAAILVFAVWLARGYQYGQDYYTISVIFPEVGALATGDPVAISGVNKGKVKELKLHEGGVLTILDISSDVVIKEDASFFVKNIGLMGERFVAIKTGKSETALDIEQFAYGSFDPGIPEVMGMMGDVITQMSNLAGSLEKTVISPQTLDKFSETIDNLHKLTNRLESAAARNMPQIDSAISDFAHLSKTVRDGIDRVQPHIDSAAGNFDAAGQKLIAMMDDIDEASKKMKSFATDLDESDGTLRMLLEDRRLYDDLRTTSRRLDSLVADIRANPKKYINFTLEIF